MTDKAVKRSEIIHTLILLLGAFIWGNGFVAQAIGSEYVDAYSFTAIRLWMSVVFLSVLIIVLDKINLKRNGTDNSPKTDADKKALLVGGLICGAVLFLAMIFQQYGIRHTSTAKAGFITALYVVLVPMISIFLKKRPGIKIWIGVVLAVIGLYLLSIKGAEGLSFGDLMVLICALFFALQILAVSYFVKNVDLVRLSRNQMFFAAIFATIVMMIQGVPSGKAVIAALPAIAYAGILSGAVGYTLQIIGQKGLNPTVASITMSLESVFAALSGWVILGQMLTPREILGCVIMFAAIVISQL